MSDLEDLNELLGLIDVFRFTVKKDESKALEDVLNKVVAQDKGKNDNTTKRAKIFNIQCFDLSTRLSDKRVVEECDEKPWDKLQQILFERLMIEDYNGFQQTTINIPAATKLLSSTNFESNSPGNEFKSSDSQILRYLYGCYYRLQQLVKVYQVEENKSNKGKMYTSLLKAETLILDQVVLYLTEPDLFPDRDKRFKNNKEAPLLLNLISSYFSRRDDLHLEIVQKFVNSIGEACKSIGDSAYEAIIAPTYVRLSQKFVNMAVDDPSLQETFSIARVFLQQPDVAKKFLERNTLKKDNSLTYQSTLLGFMICISPLPRTSQFETTFFNNPIRFGESDHKFTETQLGIKLQLLGQELHKIFHSLLKLPQTRNLFLSWMGRCIHTFKDRKKLWSNQLLMATTTMSINDGFLMNFLTVMLHLCEPFAGPYNLNLIDLARATNFVDKKLLRVDPRYCKWSNMSHENCPVHFLGLSEETFLINTDRNKSSTDKDEQQNFQPNFISDCFYGTHQVFNYGFRSIYERFYKLAHNITELQRQYADSATVSSMSGPDRRELIKERIDSAMTQFLNLKAVLTVPSRVNMQLHFCIATAVYLNHLVACRTYDEAINAKEFKTITVETLRKKDISRVCLEYIPEMLVENVLDFFLFLKHFTDQALVQASGILQPLMTLIITFMGNSSLMQNPHLRARFAEILECLMPHQSHHNPSFIGCADLFESHPLVDELAKSLVSVFVSIEMTGEGVQFEQKFTYRRPMYVVLEYLWGRPLHRKVLINLAEEAEENINSSRPPLFLSFINLLINDAIFLLDEALQYMNQLKEAERRRKTEEWQRLGPQQREREEASLDHIGRLARFHNLMSLSTIGTLAWLTSEIKTIFSHPVLVDRMANMLNYFLEHLVGPKKGKFNVNDKNDYEFKPREVLEKICQIYINLGQPESNKRYKEFCTAVSSDGRSYSETLLPQATDILFRTGMMSIGTEFEKLSQLVHKVAVRNQMDEITEDIPDTFLDPIMSTLMVDPVLLPSSKIIVDRSTIARHLLSDQTDPFNRSPLSMEDVIPDVDLKNQIESFLREKRDAQKQRRNECKDK